MPSKCLKIADGPVLIAGPTASGKSSLALHIAQEFGGQIINADALQVYGCWQVLTARPNVEEMTKAPHRLYGHVPCDFDYSVGHWLREIQPLLGGALRPIIVGGTGLYFSALTEGLAEIPPIPPDIREEAEEIKKTNGFNVFLTDLNEKTIARIDTLNPMRVQRAWEVWRATGRQISDWQDETPPPLLPLEQTNRFILDSPKEWLNDRIARRFDLMLAQGAIEEARANLTNWDPSRLSSKSIGAPELISYLSGDLTLDEAREKATISTRQYAKRQRTWFRARMKSWEIIDATQL